MTNTFTHTYNTTTSDSVSSSAGLNPNTGRLSGTGQASSDAVSALGSVGDLLTGTVLQGGEHPVVEMNGTPVQVRSSALKHAATGQKIYLRITESTPNEITLKLVELNEQTTYTPNGTMQTEISRNTARFIENWTQEVPDTDEQAGQLQKDAEEVSRNLSEEERAKLRQMGIEVSASNITFIKSLLSQMRGAEQDEQLQDAINSVRRQIIIEQPDAHPEEFQMIVGNASLNLTDALRQLNEQLPLNEEQTIYFIQNNAAFTPEELYKSAFSRNASSAYQPISEEAYQQLLPQIDRTIQSAGLTINEEQHDAARFLLNHQLPVNPEALLTYHAIQELNTTGFTASMLEEHMRDAVAEAQNPLGASTGQEIEDSLSLKHLFEATEQYFPSPSRVADSIMQDLSMITDTDMEAFAQSGLPYTLEALSGFCRRRHAGTDRNHSGASDSLSPADTTETSSNNSVTASELTARRQLEELRLKMTFRASYALASQDIHIRTRELTQVVDALREQEAAAYRQQMSADGIKPTHSAITLVQETNHKMAELPGLPAAALGRTLMSASFTINRLHADGVQLLSEYRSASKDSIASYEALMTAPRSDMGDSLNKAFRNVDNILEEMNLPVTEDNARAVRILSYNQIEITPENLSQVKAADQQVQTLIQNLQPSVVLHLVEEGINPLNMPISELNTLAEEYITDADTASDEKYSEFLQKLDRRGQISREKRTGYIGIYRLIDKITRSQGKDIGTLVHSGRSLTLQNLLTAHRSNRAAGIDTIADENFGGLDARLPEDTIQSQIEQGTDSNSGNSHAGTSAASDTAYHAQLIQQLRNALTPEVIDSMAEEAANGTTLEEFLDQIKNQLSHPDTTAETPSGLQPSELSTFGAAEYRLMQSLDVLPTLTNMETILQLTQGNGSFFRNLSATAHQLGDTENNCREKLSHIEEALTSPDEMTASYQELNQTVSALQKTGEETGTITARDLQSLKQIRAGIRILEKMSRREQYQIPFDMDGEWGVLHLSVIQNSDTKGQLQAQLSTENYGLLQADLSFNGSDWDTLLSADRQEGVSFLEENREAFAQALSEITQVSRNPEEPSGFEHSSDSGLQAPSTDEMYQIARKLVVFFRHMTRA